MGLAIIVPGISFAEKNLGKVTLLKDIPITGITSINGDSENISNIMQFSATLAPINTSENNVRWTFDDGTLLITGVAEITQNADNTCTVNVLSEASNTNVTLKVTSVSNPSLSKTKNITLSYKRVNIFDPTETILTGTFYSEDNGITWKTDRDFRTWGRMREFVDVPTGVTKIELSSVGNYVNSGIILPAVVFLDDSGEVIDVFSRTENSGNSIRSLGTTDIPSGTKKVALQTYLEKKYYTEIYFI